MRVAGGADGTGAVSGRVSLAIDGVAFSRVLGGVWAAAGPGMLSGPGSRGSSGLVIYMKQNRAATAVLISSSKG
jgi:hypothetical protein